jgi:ABC-type phosphate transport system auxiliary subunit
VKLSLSARLSSKDRDSFDAAFVSIHERFQTMSAQLDALTAQVASTNTVMDSGDAGDDPLAAAILANTPTPPAP